jgi:hypothetical protein
MRDLLIESQDRGDDRVHQKGSWSPDRDPFGRQLGRLGVTALSLIILEIYYSPDLPPAARLPGQWQPAEMQAFWEDLGRSSALTVRHSVWALTEAPTRAVPFVAERVHPVSTAVTAERLAQLLANLDDRQFEARRKASEELERLGELAEPAVRKELEKSPPLEVQRRLEKIVAEIERQNDSHEHRQRLRAVQALEKIATPEARKLLEKLAQGTPEARLSRAAKAALERLDQGPKGP